MKIGNVVLENNVFLAPMAGITDIAFRRICKEYGAGLVYSEMVSCKGMYYNDKKTEELLEIDDFERPIAVQIFGSDPEIMKSVVYNTLNSRDNIDILDINMGCPAPKIVKNGDGSALMKAPELIEKIVKAIVEVSNKPITVKIRKGWDEENINAIEVAKIIENSGAAALAIHGRTREEFYSGNADWDIIKKVKENINIPVIGNGDIFCSEDAKRMIEYTNCDAVMIGRGARGNPWIFKNTVALLNNNEILEEPTDITKVKMCINHLELLCKFKREDIAVKEMRKHIGWYVKGMKNSTDIRVKVNKINTKNDLEEVLVEYLNNIEKL